MHFVKNLVTLKVPALGQLARSPKILFTKDDREAVSPMPRGGGHNVVRTKLQFWGSKDDKEEESEQVEEIVEQEENLERDLIQELKKFPLPEGFRFQPDARPDPIPLQSPLIVVQDRKATKLTKIFKTFLYFTLDSFAEKLPMTLKSVTFSDV